MRYFFKSIATISFWKYALFSWEALAKLLAVIGALFAFMEIMDFFSIYTKDNYSKYAIIPMFVFAVVWVIVTRRPVSRVSYKVPYKDYIIEIKIGDIFSGDNDVVISTSTTFDTDMASGLISTASLQGQLATRFFQAATVEIDQQLSQELAGVAFTDRPNAPGKKREYPIGTVALVRAHSRIFYFVAMSRLNDAGTAQSEVRDIEDALTGLWKAIAERGELRNISVPIMGTGRGRVNLPRKKMVEKIAQSFADAADARPFSNRLSIVVRPEDAENFAVNLYQLRDYLTQSLHV